MQQSERRRDTATTEGTEHGRRTDGRTHTHTAKAQVSNKGKMVMTHVTHSNWHRNGRGGKRGGKTC